MRAASWFKPHPPYAAKGKGCRLVDVDDRPILDCANNFFSLIHGHAFEPVLSAISETMANGTAFGVPTEKEIELAEVLASRNPVFEQTRFCNSGTEAVLAAVKGARGLTKRERLAKFEGCYHGAYDYIEVSLDPTPQNWSDADGNPASVRCNDGTPESVLAETVVLPFGDPDRCAAILRKVGPTLAAIIVDPHPSRAGMIPISKEMVAVLHEARERDGCMLIVDEVISYRLAVGGFGETRGLKPDLVTTAKIIGGGLPVGAVSGPTERMAVFNHAEGKPRVSMGGTFSANPMSMGAGLAALSHYDAEAIGRLNGLGDTLRSNVQAELGRSGLPTFISGTGSLFRVHVDKAAAVSDYRSAYPSARATEVLKRIHQSLLVDGILLTPNCSGALSTPMTKNDVSGLSRAIADTVIREMQVAGFHTS